MPTTTARERGIALYGGGQFELGPGRGHIQYLASLFHPGLAERRRARRLQRPARRRPACRRARSRPSPSKIGFRWETNGCSV